MSGFNPTTMTDTHLKGFRSQRREDIENLRLKMAHDRITLERWMAEVDMINTELRNRP
jgi:hypothetical protein